MLKSISVAGFFAFVITLCPANANDPLIIPDTDEGVPGAGPLRRTDWFRGVWHKRRSSWLGEKSVTQKDSVVFLGDSITQGWGDNFNGAFGKLQVANRGISGDTSRGLLLRIKEDVLDLNPKAVVIMIGANDLAEKANGETVFGNVKLIIQAIKKHNLKTPIILCETFPCAPDAYRPVNEIQKINALYEKTWKDDPTVTIAKTYSLFAGKDGASLPKYMPDRVHPNLEGYNLWASVIRPLFSKLKLGDSYPDALAWIQFDRYDKQAVLYNGFYMYYADRKDPLEFSIEIPPDPSHKIAFQWVAKLGSTRSMLVDLNGKEMVVSNSARGNGNQAFFWKILNVSDFGISEIKKDKNYQLKVHYPDDAVDDAVIAGFRLIDDESQLKREKLKRTKSKVDFISPGRMSDSEQDSFRIDRVKSKARVKNDWVGKRELTFEEINKDKFLSAAVRFGETVIKHGKDVYGPKKTPVFVRFLHRELLKSPPSLCYQPPSLGGPSHPVEQTQFDRSQNLLRTLAGLSQATGNSRFADAAADAVTYMFEEYATLGSGLVIFGNHMTIDLYNDCSYSDGRSGDIFELGSIFPFYEFMYSVAPDKTEKFVKGCWEAFVRDWNTMHYNRHASFHKNVDFSKTWDRPLLPVKDLPEKIEVLGFLGVGLDLAMGGYFLGCLQDSSKPREWANRYYNVLSYHRDPKTNIWPMLLYTPSIRRNLEIYREVFPEANVTEPRVIISSWIHSMPAFFLGALASIELGKIYKHEEESVDLHNRIDDWIMGYLKAAYDGENNTLRSIILDGTDVTDHIFEKGKTLHGWGSREGDSFAAQIPSAAFFSAIAKAYRLANDENRKFYWGYLRNLFKGGDFGDIGEGPNSQPKFNYEDITFEPAHIFSLVDIYRVHKNSEVLKFIEHLGAKLIELRQDPGSGLFSRNPDYKDSYKTNKIHKESWEGMTIRERMRKEFDYDRPKVVALDVVEPLALLAIYACRTQQFEKIPRWHSGGQWGSDGSGHVINGDFERWFDVEKLKVYYEKNRLMLRQKGFEVGEGWFPSE
ncbi:GDSL-type esterase/lipase family protein [Verrucomicrobiales bacterium]|nr:GDSL-type esterase/lipase family protein [Verrucomicrobiales bacterium]MDB4737617.1 GDSL-type esterase/lipase family protein [Verrucomicrobiales bacterium]